MQGGRRKEERKGENGESKEERGVKESAPQIQREKERRSEQGSCGRRERDQERG